MVENIKQLLNHVKDFNMFNGVYFVIPSQKDRRLS